MRNHSFVAKQGHFCDIWIYCCFILIFCYLTIPASIFSLKSSLRISPSVPFLMSNMQRDPLKLALGSRLDQSSSPLTPPPSATLSGGLSHRWPGASIWPNWDLMKTPESPFSIEREAWLHRQAACMICCIP